jgi:hypothetical protein
MNKKRLKIIAMIAMAIFMFACATTASPAVIPPEQLGTAIVQTAAALASQTALYAPPTIPGSDNTAIATIQPSSTPTATETATPFIVTVATRTPTITLTSTATATHTPTKTPNQPCVVAEQVPANNTQFGSGAFFDTVWTMVNTGTLSWNEGNVDFIFQTGTKMHLNGDILDMPSTTAPNQSLVMLVHMQAPTTKGTYSETWSLKQGSTTYCTVSMLIEVK